MARVRAVTVADVARHAGVSLSTVSNVLNHPERLSSVTLQKVSRSIEMLGFIRNDAARQMRTGESLVLGLVVRGSSRPFYWRRAGSVADKAMSYGYSILVANSSQNPERQAKNTHLFESQRVQGLLATPIGNRLEEFRVLKRRGTPIVLIDYPPTTDEFTAVAVDHHHGGLLAAQHLLEVGRRRIAIMAGGSEFLQIDERYRGATEVVAGHPGAVIQPIFAHSLGLDGGAELAHAVLDLPSRKRPDAVFAPNDVLALGVIQTLQAAGARVPDDFAVIGYDDAVYPSAVGVSLTTVRQPTTLVGETALELLMEQIEEPGTWQHRTVTFQPELVVRG